MRKDKDSHERAVARQLSPWTRRRVASWTLFMLAILVAVQHLLAHAGWRPLPMGMGKQDLFTGYPMAILLGVIAAVVMDPKPRL